MHWAYKAEECLYRFYEKEKAVLDNQRDFLHHLKQCFFFLLFSCFFRTDNHNKAKKKEKERQKKGERKEENERGDRVGRKRI